MVINILVKSVSTYQIEYYFELLIHRFTSKVNFSYVYQFGLGPKQLTIHTEQKS